MRSSDLTSAVWGVRQAAPRPADRATLARLFAYRLTDDVVFSHTTAALIHRIPVPLQLERESRFHVTVPAGCRAPHAHGLIGHSLRFNPTDVTVASGFRVTTPERTWRDLARLLTLGQLVAAGDFIVHWELPLASQQDLSDGMTVAGSFRGRPLATQALDLLSDRSESPPESELRVIIALGGLPPPDINHVIVDTETGRTVRPDFMFRDHKVILEYQGDYHRTKAQWRKDMTRRSRLETAGWYVMEINADDLRDPVELVGRIRAAMATKARRVSP